MELASASFRFLASSSSRFLRSSSSAAAFFLSASYSFCSIILSASSFISVFLFIISFLKDIKFSTAIICETIFACYGFALALSQASRNCSWVISNSAISSQSSSSISFLKDYRVASLIFRLVTSWMTVYSNLFSSSVSKMIQLSSTKLMTGVTQRGLLRKFMMMSKNQS
jgi:hypothetical protein